MALSENPEARQRQLNNLKLFKKGDPSLNPGGRPAVARDFRLRCREFMETRGWANIESMANDTASPHYYRANELLLAYALGKPPSELTLTGKDSAPLVWRIVYDSPKAEEFK